MTGKTMHMCLNLRGAIGDLHRSKAKKSYFSDDSGKPLSRLEAIDALMDEVAKGRAVIPCNSKTCGNPCPSAHKGCTGFDYSGGGCPGYPTEAV
jgi:hypothetical protein